MIRWIGILACVMGCSMAKYGPGELPASNESEQAFSKAIEKDLKFLTEEVGERNAWKYHNLCKSADWIEGQFKEMGYTVKRQEYRVNHPPVWGQSSILWSQMPFYNIEAELKGSDEGVIVVGAHYDTVSDCPGADDNGTGVAVMLEMARAMAGDKCKKTVRFVAFVNEENPFFESEYRGSLVYARNSKQKGERIDGMICLEMLGSYNDEKGTQDYPISAGKWLYGDRGNFLLFAGNIQSWDLTERASRLFWDNASINCERFVYPDFIKARGSSDMESFWEMGYRAVVVTDTAMYRNGFYHTPFDKVNAVDIVNLGRVAEGMLGVMRGLARSDKQ